MNKVYGMILSHNCGTLLKKAFDKIPKEEFDKIFITDDGSDDTSLEIANSLGVEVVISRKSGYGANVKNGLKWGFENGADYIVEIHGDGAQFNPKAVIPAKKFINTNYDFIIGSRFINTEKTLSLGIPKLRYYANIFLSKIDKSILKLPFTEFHTGFRIYGKKFNNINFKNFSDNYLLSFEVIAYAAYMEFKAAEVPVECDYIDDHTSHSYIGASIYAVQHFLTLLRYLLAKAKIKTGIFKGS
tara:strand:+ start:202 stop:930 length:729 start_codon:yes stop_codon:yes gene_type:complete